MGLLPKDEGQAAWEAVAGKVTTTLDGNCSSVKQPAGRLSTAATPGTNHGKLALNKGVTAVLHPMTSVRYVINPEKKQGKPEHTGGLLEITAPTTGTYALGTVSAAWIDMVNHDERKLTKAKLYQWVDFCSRRMKAGLFELQAGARYWIQISASPDSAIDVFVAGPLN